MNKYTKQTLNMHFIGAQDKILDLLNQRVNNELDDVLKNLINNVIKTIQANDYAAVHKVVSGIACERGLGGGSSPASHILTEDQLDIYNRALANLKDEMPNE